MILGIGAAFVDIILFVDERFLLDHAIEKGSVTAISMEALHQLLHDFQEKKVQVPGGSCANVIRPLAHLGWPCTLTGKIGKDTIGDFLLKNLAQNKIQAHYIPTDLPTGQVVCLVTPDGERTMRDMLGASSAMEGKDLLPSLFANKQLVHIEGYTLFNNDLAETAMQLAHEAHALISFDLANFKVVQHHRPTLLKLIEKYVDILFANAQEAQELTGLGPKEACRQIAEQCAYAAVTMGKEGCWIAHGQTLMHVPASPVDKVVDTTGAGDLFSAGFLDGILRQLPPEICAKQGCYLASQVIQIEGACIPEQNWEEIAVWLQSNCKQITRNLPFGQG